MNKEWSELNKTMQSQMKKKDTYIDGISTLFELRKSLMQTIISFKKNLSREDYNAIPFINADGYIIAGVTMLFVSLYNEKSKAAKKRVLMVIFAVIAESAFYVVQISGIFAEITQVYDITMIGYSIGTIFMFVAIFRCDLLGTSEIAREFMIDRLSEGIVAVDNDGIVRYFNEPAKRLYPELKMLSGKIPSEVINAVRGSENITLDEHIYKVEQNPLMRGGESFGTLYALVDETEHIRYLQELEKQKSRADSANQAKSAFLANMSHDIRTPINAVLGMNEMILRECDDSDILGYSEKIRSSGNTLLGLINDILDFSKIEAGKLDIIPVDYDLTSVLNDLVSMIQLRAEAKGLTLETRFDGNIPKLLHGDEIRIKQIVTNILTNAVKYTEKGSVTFALTYEKLSEESILLKVSVSDTGIGIKQEDIPKLFSAFDRIEEERNRSIEGTGLGMSITQRLLAMMGSRLEVASEYGKGSEFSFAIEQKVISYEPVGDFEEALRRSIANRKKYREKFTAPDAHILVVDDTPMNLEVFVNLLKKTLVRIDTAASGSECIALAAKKKYDVIFLDHMMPDKNGIETLKELRALSDTPNADTPAICLTANAVSGARETYLNAGFDDYLTKPVEPEKLEKMIMEYLPEEKIIQVTEEISGRSVSSSGRSAVLVVDDDELIRKNAESILRPSYDIICADSGKTAIETAERERPDLILLDINLGGMDGFDVLRQLKKSEAAHDIPVIFITGDTGEETEVRGFREGASDHVRKPFVPEVLLQRTKRVIDLYHFQSGLKQEVGRQTARADRLSLEMMMALSKTVDAKDRYTNGHSGRVAEYSAEIARRMGKSEAEQEKIYEMGLMHDIGKIGVSEEIINKTSRLTYEEFAQIKKHTVIGCDILSTITEMPDLATGARSHHERYDGTGYPDGLKGEDIPEAARIICVADCYDAMTSTRTYSTPRSQAAVRAEIERCSGSQFDPVIAAVMLQMIDDDTGYKMNEQGGAHVWKNMDKLWNIQPDEPDEINKSLLPEIIYDIGEIDVRNGLLHCGTEQIYTDTLTAFAEAVGEQTDVIEQYWNARDIESLTIKVHAIKSTSRIIGAEDIGTLAERLEKAGHDNDITALENGMDELLTRCRSLGRQLKPLVKADDDSALPPISPEELSELYGIIREFYSVADYDSFTQMIENLGSYRIPDSEKERCRALREAADALDYDLIPEILDKE